ncbi:MAG: RNA polymerase sigma factor [Proteobacteria bacterium]|nr:RNA polymerase sigma factor [Pseudomonadota bacterium]
MPPEKSKHAHWFAEEVYPHESILRSWLKKKFPGSCDVDDVIQEAYLRVLKARDRDVVQFPRAFLFTVARNLAIDSLRRVEVSRIIPLAENELETVMDDAEAPRETVAREQELEILKMAMETLPERCREIFTLRKIHDMSQSDIARTLGISVNTVTAQISIGVRRCTEYLENYLKNGERFK